MFNKSVTVHEMKLRPEPFGKIKSGAKTIELRLYDEKRQKIRVGDVIIFTSTESGEEILATVKKLHRFDSFEALYKNLPLLKCGYTAEDVDTAQPSDMENYYSVEEQQKYGVVGIELDCVSSLLFEYEYDLQLVYDQLKDRYPVELTNSFALDDGFTIDVPIIVARHHGQILWLYDDGAMLVLDVFDEAQTMGTHWHPLDEHDAAEDIAEFMEGRDDYPLIPFPKR